MDEAIYMAFYRKSFSICKIPKNVDLPFIKAVTLNTKSVVGIVNGMREKQ